ncbi:toxin-antitoxin system YwqK family antitoxin [Gammaproteobacteria bacterium]|nr:toxin-antitoxin system YwqK family antitoxin [Gammaproteobacteria bacterium]
MKKLLPILFVLIITSCSPEPKEPEVQSIYLQERGGVYYEVNSTIPFTGKNRTYHTILGVTSEQIWSYRDGLWNGVRKTSTNGNVVSKTIYKDGEKDGLDEMFKEDGQLNWRKNYKDGEQHGLEEVYYKNGQLNWRSNYKDGEQHGLEEVYYKNGQLISKVNFISGDKDGLEESYQENGYLVSRVNFKGGKEDGLKEFYRNGQLITRTCITDNVIDWSYCN